MFELIIINSRIKEAKKSALEAFGSIFSCLSAKVYTISAIVVNICSWLIAQFIASEVNVPQIALHYSVDFGIDYYGDTSRIFIVPLLGAIILIFNLLIVLMLYRHKDVSLFSHMLLLTALLSNIILLVSIAIIYLINFR